ncbi:MAG: DUF2333 family protein [Aquimonas sp.]|nr:DUF2333 family protein [Aquimonas sp.]
MNSLSSHPRRWLALGAVVIGLPLLMMLALMWWWDHEPPVFDPVAAAQDRAGARGGRLAVGAVSVEALRVVAGTLLDKRGGYLSNDRLPPGVLMDNVPNWEFGALVQVRDYAKAFRNEFSRSQSQSVEDPDLAEADPLFSSPNNRWLLPSSESQYRKAIAHIEAYGRRLPGDGRPAAQFHARADNLADWLSVVEKRLGSLSQRLSASAAPRQGKRVEGEAPAEASPTLSRTPWSEIDDVFYEARGSTWALLHFLRAAEHDFAQVLRDKNAEASLRQVIRELEESQQALGSPIVLNGAAFGFFANHSLVMANYVSRANAAVIDLRRLLERG